MLILRLFAKRLHVSEQKPLCFSVKTKPLFKKPYFALKTGEKFAQTFGLTVRSPIMKIWVLLFIKSRRYGVECYRLQIIVILNLLNIQTRCQTYKTRNCRKIEASQKIILNFAVSKVSNKFSFLKYTFWNTIERWGKQDCCK